MCPFLFTLHFKSTACAQPPSNARRADSKGAAATLNYVLPRDFTSDKATVYAHPNENSLSRENSFLSMRYDECGQSSGSCHCESGNDNSDGAGANLLIDKLSEQSDWEYSENAQSSHTHRFPIIHGRHSNNSAISRGLSYSKSYYSILRLTLDHHLLP